MNRMIGAVGSIVLMASVAYAGCIEPDGDGTEDLEIPGSATEIGDSGLHLEGGESSELPAPSEAVDAPTITSMYVEETGSNSFSLYITVDSDHPIVSVYLDFGELGVYATSSLSGSLSQYTACDALFDSQGYECTEACLRACDCAYCPDDVQEDAVEGGCASSCSISTHEGTLGQAPYNGSETVFADVIYNGYDGIPGILDAACDGTVCDEAAEATSKVVEIGFYVQDWPELVPLAAGVVESQPANGGGTLTSGKTAPGTLSLDACHHGECF